MGRDTALMADGTTYEIDVQAEGIGTDATADELIGLADAIEAAEAVLTPFDSALAAASSRLDEASAAADAASLALSEAEDDYKRLERAATSAAKKVEKAAAAGKDTTKLQAAADAAATAVQTQATAVDAARSRADAATAAQKKLAAAYRTVEKRAAKASQATQETRRSFGDIFGAAGALGGPLGGLAGQISGIGDGLRAGGKKGGLVLAAFAAGNALIMLSTAAVGLGVAMAGAVFGLLGFAIASDKATSDKLAKAWERAKKNVKGLFEGVKTEKLVEPVNSLLNLLNKNTSAGKGLAKIIEQLLNPLIDSAVEAGPLVEELFKRLILGALRAIIFVLKVRNAIVGMVPKETRRRIREVLLALLGLGQGAENFNSKAAGVRFSLQLVSGTIWIFIGQILTLKQLLGTVWDDLASDEVQSWAQGVLNDIADFADDLYNDALQAGSDVVDGLVQGLKDGVGAVAEAAKNLGKSILDSIKKATKSSSPSLLLRMFGRDDLAGALAIGQKEGEPRVRRAARELGEASMEETRRPLRTAGEPRQTGETTARGNGRGSNGKTVHMHFGENSVVAYVQNDKEMPAKIREILIALMDGTAAQIGGGEVTEVA